MLTIRLTRKGKKNQPFFRLILIEKKRSSTGGRAVEDLGYVDPLTKKRSFKKERILYWISKGAQPSDTAHNLFVSEKIIDSKKRHVSKVNKSTEASVPAQTEQPKVAASEEASLAQDKRETSESIKEETPVAEVPPKEDKPVETEKPKEVKEESKPEEKKQEQPKATT